MIGWGQFLTLKNDPTCSLAAHVVSNINFIWMVWDSNINLENEPISSLAQRVVMNVNFIWMWWGQI